jgi:hypothetical protein
LLASFHCRAGAGAEEGDGGGLGFIEGEGGGWMEWSVGGSGVRDTRPPNLGPLRPPVLLVACTPSRFPLFGTDGKAPSRAAPAPAAARQSTRCRATTDKVRLPAAKSIPGYSRAGYDSTVYEKITHYWCIFRLQQICCILLISTEGFIIFYRPSCLKYLFKYIIL